MAIKEQAVLESGREFNLLIRRIQTFSDFRMHCIDWYFYTSTKQLTLKTNKNRINFRQPNELKDTKPMLSKMSSASVTVYFGLQKVFRKKTQFVVGTGIVVAKRTGEMSNCSICSCFSFHC